MPVVDASVLVAFLSGGDASESAAALIRDEQERLYAPYLIDPEVGHALRRLVAAEAIGPARAEDSLAVLARMPLQRAPHTWLLHFTWALRTQLSFYDAIYVALAAQLEAPLVTVDARLARAAAGLEVEVQLVS